jgi:hypothetical protein
MKEKTGGLDMNTETKEMLLALIKGLTTYDEESQYYEGTPCIKGKNLQLLIRAIECS